MVIDYDEWEGPRDWSVTLLEDEGGTIVELDAREGF
jgi:hypothetical protein